VEEQDKPGVKYQEMVDRASRRTTLPLFGKAGSRFVHLNSCSRPDPDKEVWDSLIRPVYRLRRLLRRLLGLR
jgi:hypothetical protein